MGKRNSSESHAVNSKEDCLRPEIETSDDSVSPPAVPAKNGRTPPEESDDGTSHRPSGSRKQTWRDRLKAQRTAVSAQIRQGDWKTPRPFWHVDEATLRRWLKVAVATWPFLAAYAYTLEYTYVYQYLIQFGVSPEDVGITQAKLLTRAAFLALFFVAVVGAALAFAACLATLIYAIDAAMRRAFTGRNPDAPDGANDAGRLVGRSRRGAQALAIVGLGLLDLYFASALWDRPLDAGRVLIIVGVTAAPAVAILADLRGRVAVVAVSVGAMALILVPYAYSGAAREGNKTQVNGTVPGLLSGFGADIAPVKPIWLNRAAQPTNYRGENLLRLGLNGATAFLYDCRTRTTVQVLQAAVSLEYLPEWNDQQDFHKILSCA